MHLRNRAFRTVVFVESGRWSCFSHMSAALGRSGYRTVRISTDGSDYPVMLSRFDYSDQIIVDRISDLGSLAAPAVNWANVVDVQCPETNLPEILEVLETTDLPAEVQERLRHRAACADKLVTSRRLHDAGVSVPPTLSAESVTVDEAIRRLGLPMVVKSRLGAGGGGVTIVRSVDETLALIARTPDLGRVFFEKFIAGRMVRYVACNVDGSLEQEATYIGHRIDDTVLGPASSVELISSPDLLAIGRDALVALDARGLVNIEAIEDAFGGLWVIDVNLRAWGSIVALRRAGLDYLTSYRRTLGETPMLPAPVGVGVIGSQVLVFPDAVSPALADGPYIVATMSFFALLFQYSRWLGPRFGVGGVVDFAHTSYIRFHRYVGRSLRRFGLIKPYRPPA